MIIIPIKWLFHWEYTLFSDKPIYHYFVGGEAQVTSLFSVREGLSISSTSQGWPDLFPEDQYHVAQDGLDTGATTFLTGQELDSGKAISFVGMFNLIEWYNNI